MSLKLKTTFHYVSIIQILCPILIRSVQIVEVPPELHNWTFTYNDTQVNNGSVKNIVTLDSETVNSDGRTAPVTQYSVEPVVTYTTDGVPLADSEKHPCSRNCTEDSGPMICRYQFKIEHYQTMSKACYDCPFNIDHCNLKDCIAADGVKRPLIVANRQLPGPAIEVCHGDLVEVEVLNMLFDETTSIHWHGQHQRGSQFMDGVPYVTQCPIAPGTKFLYRFNASVPGTHFWHSHSGLQRGDGVFGSFVVKLPLSTDQYSDLFDYDLPEHVINIVDWTHLSGIFKFVAHHHSDGDNKPFNILINGKGRYQEFENEHKEILFTPIEKFTVTQGYRYRFRLINSGALNCPIDVSVDNHTLVIISGDGADLEPVEAKSLVTYAGERFDFIVEMNQPVDNYWIRFRGLMDCDERFHSVFQVAVLHYNGADDTSDPAAETGYDIKPHGLQLNSLNLALHTNNSLIMAELRSTSTSTKDPRLKPEADLKFYISYDFYAKDNIHYHRPFYYGFNQTEASQRIYTPQLNHISMKFPPFPLMSNVQESNKLDFCNSSTVPNECDSMYCECIHLLRVPKDAVVELILIDEGFTYDANHPFHLHGYNFRVIGMDRLGSTVTAQEIKKLDKEGQLMRNLEDAPIKDTVTVPDGGYTIVRWHATNPGFWLFHCHIEFHMEIGMALIFKVGDDMEYPHAPKNFPKCNNYYPIEETVIEESFTYENYATKDSNDIPIDEIETGFIQLLSQTASQNSTSRTITLSRELIFFVLVQCLVHVLYIARSI